MLKSDPWPQSAAERDRLGGMHEDGAKIKWVNRRVSTDQSVIGEVLYHPGGFAGPRWQDCFELMVLHSGGGSFPRRHSTPRLTA